jgi:hypothetical protein
MKPNWELIGALLALIVFWLCVVFVFNFDTGSI